MSSRIKITFLGTSAQIPTSRRNHTSIFLNYDNEGILIDCGEGTQRQIRKAKINPMKVTRLLITHWHGDHVLGIPGLLQTLAFNDYNKIFYVYGPKGTREFFKEILKTFVFCGKIKIEIEEVSEGKFFENEKFYLESKKVFHGTPCNAYSFIKKGNIRIDKSKLKKYKILEGPHLRNLKEGKSIFYNKKNYSAEELTYKENNKKLSFVIDTSFSEEIIPFVKNSDLLICESSFDSELKKEAEEKYHMTSDQAAKIAKESNSKKLILTHISQRYDKDLKKILSDAKKIFRNTSIAEDLDAVEVN